MKRLRDVDEPTDLRPEKPTANPATLVFDMEDLMTLIANMARDNIDPDTYECRTLGPALYGMAPFNLLSALRERVANVEGHLRLMYVSKSMRDSIRRSFAWALWKPQLADMIEYNLYDGRLDYVYNLLSLPFFKGPDAANAIVRCTVFYTLSVKFDPPEAVVAQLKEDASGDKYAAAELAYKIFKTFFFYETANRDIYTAFVTYFLNNEEDLSPDLFQAHFGFEKRDFKISMLTDSRVPMLMDVVKTHYIRFAYAIGASPNASPKLFQEFKEWLSVAKLENMPSDHGLMFGIVDGHIQHARAFLPVDYSPSRLTTYYEELLRHMMGVTHTLPWTDSFKAFFDWVLINYVGLVQEQPIAGRGDNVFLFPKDLILNVCKSRLPNETFADRSGFLEHLLKQNDDVEYCDYNRSTMTVRFSPDLVWLLCSQTVALTVLDFVTLNTRLPDGGRRIKAAIRKAIAVRGEHYNPVEVAIGFIPLNPTRRVAFFLACRGYMNHPGVIDFINDLNWTTEFEQARKFALVMDNPTQQVLGDAGDDSVLAPPHYRDPVPDFDETMARRFASFIVTSNHKHYFDAALYSTTGIDYIVGLNDAYIRSMFIHVGIRCIDFNLSNDAPLRRFCELIMAMDLHDPDLPETPRFVQRVPAMVGDRRFRRIFYSVAASHPFGVYVVTGLKQRRFRRSGQIDEDGSFVAQVVGVSLPEVPLDDRSMTVMGELIDSGLWDEMSDADIEWLISVAGLKRFPSKWQYRALEKVVQNLAKRAIDIPTRLWSLFLFGK